MLVIIVFIIIWLNLRAYCVYIILSKIGKCYTSEKTRATSLPLCLLVYAETANDAYFFNLHTE